MNPHLFFMASICTIAIQANGFKTLILAIIYPHSLDVDIFGLLFFSSFYVVVVVVVI